MSSTRKIVIKVNNDYEEQIKKGIDDYIEKYGVPPFKLRCGTLARRMIMSNEPLKQYLKDMEIGLAHKKSNQTNLIEIDSKNGVSFEGFLNERVNSTASYSQGFPFTSSTTSERNIWL